MTNEPAPFQPYVHAHPFRWKRNTKQLSAPVGPYLQQSHVRCGEHGRCGQPTRERTNECTMKFFSNLQVKLTDFGLTRRAGMLVKKRARSLPTCPPEIWEMLSLEGYCVETGSDVWQIGMLVFIGLTARLANIRMLTRSLRHSPACSLDNVQKRILCTYSAVLCEKSIDGLEPALDGSQTQLGSGWQGVWLAGWLVVCGALHKPTR